MPSITSPGRVAAVRDTGLLDAPARDELDRFTRLVVRLLGADVALLSLVDEDRQFFASAIGLPEPWASTRETPLSHSFCQHVVISDRPLVVRDAREDSGLRSNLAIRDLGVIAYAGVPLRSPEGEALGALCAIGAQPRTWTADEVAVLEDLAAAASSEIALRSLAARHTAFVQDVMHVLRSSTTALRMQLDTIATQQPSSPGLATEVAVAHGQVRSLAGQLEALAAGTVAARFGFESTTDVTELVASTAVRWQQVGSAVGRPVIAEDAPSIEVRVDVAALTRAVDALLLLALDHGQGAIRLATQDSDDAVRISLRTTGGRLPDAVAAGLLRRVDHDPTHPAAVGPASAGEPGRERSLGEFVARHVGGRLSLPIQSGVGFDIVLPRRVVAA